MENDEGQNYSPGVIDKKETWLEGMKNEITLLAGILACVVGLVMFVISNVCNGVIKIDIEGIYAVLGFSATCFGIGKIGRK